MSTRTAVWTKHTPYTSLSGMPGEHSRQTHARHTTDQRALTDSLTALHAAHDKELRRLRQHRKSLETSMLAYSQKMRKISKERTALMDPHPSSTLPTLTKSPSDNALSQRADQQEYPGPSAIERLMSIKKASTQRDKSSRVSRDSGIDVEEENSNTGNLLMVQDTASGRLRASSFAARDAERVEQDVVRNNSADQIKKKLSVDMTAQDLATSGQPRQRRTGMIEKPDETSLVIHLSEDHPLSPIPDDASEAVSITPFPDSEPSERSGTTGNAAADADGKAPSPMSHSPRGSGKIHRLSVNTRESYWSFRKAQRRFSIKPEKVRLSDSDISRSKTIRKKKFTLPPQPASKNFASQFRYSEAVANVIQSIYEDRDSPKTPSSALRRASNFLPSLDMEDLRQEVQRLREEGKLRLTPEQSEALTTSNPDLAATSEDLHHMLLAAMTRERSFSTPDVLSVTSESEQGERGEDSETVTPKPALRKFQSTFFTEDPRRKSVQFSLPSQGSRTVHHA